MAEQSEIRRQVREKYGAVAQGRGAAARAPDALAGETGGRGAGAGEAAATRGCCSPSAPADPPAAARCCDGTADVMLQLGYDAEQARAVPAGADLGLGCGNPLAHAALRPGETVLDLGSGAGVDVFLAAREVGPEGWAIGVDMTPQMLERARANADKHGYANVEFRLGEIEHLPAADGSVDAVISNCVINLSPEKARVFREAFRVLRPGGRLVVSDLVLRRPLPPALKSSLDAYVGCIAGASLEEEYLRLIRDAGFEDVEVVEERRYTPGEDALPAEGAEREAYDAVVSLKVRAWKRRAARE